MEIVVFTTFISHLPPRSIQLMSDKEYYFSINENDLITKADQEMDKLLGIGV